MVLRSTLKQATVTSTFTVTTRAGRVSGRATARLTLDGDTAHYKGTATITKRHAPLSPGARLEHQVHGRRPGQRQEHADQLSPAASRY